MNGGMPRSDRQGSARAWHFQAISSLPTFLRDNEFLLDTHRPELRSVQECWKSVFMIHTETLNIWTHLVGFVGCFLLAAYYYLLEASDDILGGVAFGAFFGGALFCLAASTLFHILICHSESVCKSMAKLDYCGVVTLIVSSFMPWVYYGFYCSPTSTKFGYMSGVTVLGSLCVYVVMQDRFREPRFRSLRAGLFIGLGLTGILPGFHYILTDGQTVGYHEWLLLMAALYIAGGVIYAMRIPERLSPGMFDIVCQSHQILHVCVLGGIVTCFHGVSQLARYRHTHPCLVVHS